MTTVAVIFGVTVIWVAISWAIGTRLGVRLKQRRLQDTRPVERGER